MERLLEIMRRLRGPGGCPWDRAQSFASVAPYTLEEAYEVDDAIRRGDLQDLCDELGDLLFQVVFHARMAEEAGRFDFADVVEGVSDKLERRHPHVFGEADTDEARLGEVWEATKAREREARAQARGEAADPFAGVPRTLPALSRAAKLQKRAPGEVPDDAQLRAAFDAVLALGPADDAEVARERLGRLLFDLVRRVRAHRLDPERALRDANAAFEERVRAGAT